MAIPALVPSSTIYHTYVDDNGVYSVGTPEAAGALCVICVSFSVPSGSTPPTVEVGDDRGVAFAARPTDWSAMTPVHIGNVWTWVFHGVMATEMFAGSAGIGVKISGLPFITQIRGNIASVAFVNADVAHQLQAISTTSETQEAPSVDLDIDFAQVSFFFGRDISEPTLAPIPSSPIDEDHWSNFEFGDYPFLSSTYFLGGMLVGVEEDQPLGWDGFNPGGGRGEIGDFTFAGIIATVAICTSYELAPVPTIPARSNVPKPGKGWQYILCNSPDPTDPYHALEEIGELESARGKTLEIVRNRAGSAGCTISMYDDYASEILDRLSLSGDIRGSLRKSLLVRRNNIDMWSGPITTINGVMAEGSSALALGAVGWMEYLFHRELEAIKAYTATPQDSIAFGLISLANEQEPEHPSPIFPGSVYGLMPNRSITFQKGETFGACIQKLSDVESGFDFDIDPWTREMNIHAWDDYAIRPDVKLGLNWGPENISKLEWTENGLATRNRLFIVGNNNVPISAQDVASQDDHGLFVETMNLPTSNGDILPAFANAELVIRSRPQVTYSISLKQKTEEDDGAPRIFEDFFIGDQISFTAHDGQFKINDQGIRIFGANLAISDDGNQEIVNSLMTNPAT